MNTPAHNTPATAFAWRDRNGVFHSIQSMETNHLFYTFRMIWNNSMPVEARVGDVRLYNFGRFYTAEYMKQAILHIWPELQTRNLNPSFLAQLDQMKQHYIKLLEGGNEKQNSKHSELPLPK